MPLVHTRCFFFFHLQFCLADYALDRSKCRYNILREFVFLSFFFNFFFFILYCYAVGVGAEISSLMGGSDVCVREGRLPHHYSHRRLSYNLMGSVLGTSTPSSPADVRGGGVGLLDCGCSLLFFFFVFLFVLVLFSLIRFYAVVYIGHLFWPLA